MIENAYERIVFMPEAYWSEIKNPAWLFTAILNKLLPLISRMLAHSYPKGALNRINSIALISLTGAIKIRLTAAQKIVSNVIPLKLHV